MHGQSTYPGPPPRSRAAHGAEPVQPGGSARRREAERPALASRPHGHPRHDLAPIDLRHHARAGGSALELRRRAAADPAHPSHHDAWATAVAGKDAPKEGGKYQRPACTPTVPWIPLGKGAAASQQQVRSPVTCQIGNCRHSAKRAILLPDDGRAQIESEHSPTECEGSSVSSLG